ncbi:MAG TPA: PQQ-binding-like beta-propeller repeat protein [Planctomycetaceae bacterium]|nr:PQQ-binding-like beta-propeller repeat protein [Planctomycetaceae bacterium]
MCLRARRLINAARALPITKSAQTAAVILILLCSAPFAAEPLKAPDDASWSSFRKNLAQTGIAKTTLPEKLELLWQIELGEQVVASAAIVGEHVYIPCLSGELVCVSRQTGKTLWTYKSVEKVEPNSFAPGFKSSPTVSATTVYLGDEEGLFHAVDRATGKQQWTFETGGEIYSSPAIVNGRIIFGSYDNFLYCLNESDGKFAWKFQTEGYVHCAPAIADKYTFIAGCDEHLRIIDIETGMQANDLPLMTYLIASPTVIDDLLYVGTYASEVVCVDWRKLEVKWRYKTGAADFPFHSSAAVTEKTIVIGGRDKLVHAIDRATGEKRWTFPTRAKIDSSPAIVGERVFIGSNDGNLYELGLNDGKEKWKFNAGKPISAGPAIGEGVLVIGSESRDGKVYCFGKK